jgi:hypothetical protein
MGTHHVSIGGDHCVVTVHSDDMEGPFAQSYRAQLTFSRDERSVVLRGKEVDSGRSALCRRKRGAVHTARRSVAHRLMARIKKSEAGEDESLNPLFCL